MGGQVQELGSDGNWHVTGFSDPQSGYVGSTKINFDASGNPIGSYSPTNGGEISQVGAPGSYKVSPVSMVDTSSAISQVNNQKGFLDTTYPVSPLQNGDPNAKITPTTLPTNKSDTNETVKMSGKAYFTNSNGQQAEYTQDQLNDPNTQAYLKSNGYVLTKSDGFNVNSDFTTGTNTLQSNYNSASSQVEKLSNDFLTYNVDNDPTYQAQANSIKANFANLRSEMEKTNAQRQAALQTLGYRTGASQYADGIQMGLQGEELKQGNQRIADLTREEASAISAARLAYQTGKFTEFNNKINALKDIRDQKYKELEDYNKKIADFTKNLLDQQKFEFDVYKFQQENKGKPMIVSPGSSIYDPGTGKFLGTAPERPSDNKPITEKIGNSLIQWNPTTSSWDTVFTGGSGTNDASLEWAKSIRNGTAKISDVPSEERAGAIAALNAMPPDQTKIAPLKEKISSINELLNSPGLNSAVGTNWAGRIPLWDALTGENQNFIAGVQQLVSQDTLQTLIDLKSQGGTLGALSEKELQTLQSASTKIGTWTKRDKGGNVVGYATSQELFKKELTKIQSSIQKIIDQSTTKDIGSASKALDEYYIKNPNQRAVIDALGAANNPKTGQPYTDEEKAQILGVTFNGVGGDTKLATRIANIQDGTKGGQCGRFVNSLTNLGVGDTYASKLAKMDKSILRPEPGMVFVMPGGEFGHTGFILSVNNGIATVKDSNYGLDETIKTHQIPVSKMTGFRRV